MFNRDGGPALVIVCIPTYNAAATLGETIKSLLSQTHTRFEIHISDNASTDNTVEIAAGFRDNRIHIHCNAVNVGAEGNFTRCIQMAAGQYTAIFHADDLYHHQTLEKMVDYLEKNFQVEAVVAQAETIDTNSQPIGRIDMIPSIGTGKVRLFSFVELLKDIFRHQNRIVIASLLVRSAVLRNDIKNWGDGSFKSAADVDLYLRLARRAPIAIFGDRLIKYRISEHQFSERIRNRLMRPDFFLLTDSYAEEGRSSGILNDEDFRNLRWLESHDRIARAMNAVMSGSNDLARQLLKGSLSFDALHFAIASRRGLVTFMAALYLNLASLLGFPKFCILAVRKMKRLKWN